MELRCPPNNNGKPIKLGHVIIFYWLSQWTRNKIYPLLGSITAVGMNVVSNINSSLNSIMPYKNSSHCIPLASGAILQNWFYIVTVLAVRYFICAYIYTWLTFANKMYKLWAFSRKYALFNHMYTTTRIHTLKWGKKKHHPVIDKLN